MPVDITIVLLPFFLYEVENDDTHYHNNHWLNFIVVLSYVVSSGSNSTIPASHTFPDYSLNKIGFNHHNETSPVSNKITASTSSSRPVNLASLSSQVANLQGNLDRLLSVMEGLRSDVSRIQETVSRIESTVFIGEAY